MASYTYNKSLSGGREPLRLLVLFAAGATTTVERGEILELSGGVFLPLNADQAMAGIIAIADHTITSAHLGGYYPVIIPRPGDVFDYDLATAGNPVRGASLYWVSSTTIAEAGTNVLGEVYDHSGYPQQQGNADVGDGAGRGTTIVDAKRISMTFLRAVSYYAVLQG